MESDQVKIDAMRKFARSKTQVPVRFYYSAFSGMGIIDNISKGGAGLITDIFLHVGSQVTLDLNVKGQLVSMRAKVVRIAELNEEFYKIGLQFVKKNPEYEVPSASKRKMDRFIPLEDAPKDTNLLIEHIRMFTKKLLRKFEGHSLTTMNSNSSKEQLKHLGLSGFERAVFILNSEGSNSSLMFIFNLVGPFLEIRNKCYIPSINLRSMFKLDTGVCKIRLTQFNRETYTEIAEYIFNSFDEFTFKKENKPKSQKRVE